VSNKRKFYSNPLNLLTTKELCFCKDKIIHEDEDSLDNPLNSSDKESEILEAFSPAGGLECVGVGCCNFTTLIIPIIYELKLRQLELLFNDWNGKEYHQGRKL
jgi:hypothetical protein